MAHNLTFIAAAAYMYNAIWTSIVSKGHAQLSFSTTPPSPLLQSCAAVWAPTALKTLQGLERALAECSNVIWLTGKGPKKITRFKLTRNNTPT